MRIKRTSLSDFWPQPTEPEPKPVAQSLQSPTGRDTFASMRRFATGFRLPEHVLSARIRVDPAAAEALTNADLTRIEEMIQGCVATEAERYSEQTMLFGFPTSGRNENRTLVIAGGHARLRALQDYIATDLSTSRFVVDSLIEEYRAPATPWEATPYEQEPAPAPKPRADRYNYYDERQRHGKSAAPPSDLITRLTRRL